MEEETKQEVTEFKEEEKFLQNGGIGFDSATPITRKDKNKPERFQKNLPGKKLRRWTKLCTVFGIIFSTLTMMYFLLPLFAAVIGGLLAVCIVMFMICSVVLTLGLALMNDGYREWIGNDMMDVPNFFFNLADNVVKLAPYFFVVAIPGLVFTGVGLALGIVGKAKQYRFFTSYIVLNAIFFTLALIFTLIFFASGMMILQPSVS